MSETPPPTRSFADRLREPRVLAALGGGAVLLAVVVAAALALSHRGDAQVPEGASSGSLQVEAGKTTTTGAAASLRCFVGGQMVGEMPLADCAARNGVSSQALDVGLPPPPSPPETAAADPDANPPTADGGQGAGTPTTASVAPSTSPSDADAAADAGPTGDARGQCLRYAGGGWRGAPRGAGSLKACTHALFDGRCVARGDAIYGRYGALTLRAVPGRIEVASDNRSFHPLVAVDEGCNIDD